MANKKKAKKTKEKPVRPVPLESEKSGGALLGVLYTLLVLVGIFELVILTFIGVRMASVFSGEYYENMATGANTNTAVYSQTQSALPDTVTSSVLGAASTSTPTPTPTPASGLVATSGAAVKPEVSMEDPAAQTGSDAQGTFVGSTESNKYHWPECQWAEEILPENEIWFGDEAEALSAGYTACEVCG